MEKEPEPFRYLPTGPESLHLPLDKAGPLARAGRRL